MATLERGASVEWPLREGLLYLKWQDIKPVKCMLSVIYTYAYDVFGAGGHVTI